MTQDDATDLESGPKQDQTPDDEDEGSDETSQIRNTRPLVVDMDGTLLRTDMTFANAFKFAGQKPLGLLQVPGWLAQGRNTMKANLAALSLPSFDNLPLNSPCIALIEQARNDGRLVVLASASDTRVVDGVAREIGLFDEWYGSDESVNLKGAEKASFLVGKFGHKGFDYVGDSSADIAVWQVAHTAYTIDADSKLRQAAEGANPNALHLNPAPISILQRYLPLWKAMRPHQWSKNSLIFLPLLAGHFWGFGEIARRNTGFYCIFGACFRDLYRQ